MLTLDLDIIEKRRAASSFLSSVDQFAFPSAVGLSHVHVHPEPYLMQPPTQPCCDAAQQRSWYPAWPSIAVPWRRSGPSMHHPAPSSREGGMTQHWSDVAEFWVPGVSG